MVALWGEGNGHEHSLGLSAVGFHRFIGRDIEFLPQSISEANLLNRYSNVGAWLLQDGLVLKDGDTCGLSAEERMFARYKNKGEISPNPVVELVIERLDETAASLSLSHPTRDEAHEGE